MAAEDGPMALGVFTSPGLGGQLRCRKGGGNIGTCHEQPLSHSAPLRASLAVRPSDGSSSFPKSALEDFFPWKYERFKPALPEATLSQQGSVISSRGVVW